MFLYLTWVDAMDQHSKAWIRLSDTAHKNTQQAVLIIGDMQRRVLRAFDPFGLFGF